jgi:hypothetical protein
LYKPVELMVPPAAPSLIDQLTAVFETPVTLAVNWSVPMAPTVADAAVTETEAELGGCEVFDELPPQAVSAKPKRVAAITVNALVRTVVSPRVRVRVCELLN